MRQCENKNERSEDAPTSADLLIDCDVFNSEWLQTLTYISVLSQKWIVFIVDALAWSSPAQRCAETLDSFNESLRLFSFFTVSLFGVGRTGSNHIGDHWCRGTPAGYTPSFICLPTSFCCLYLCKSINVGRGARSYGPLELNLTYMQRTFSCRPLIVLLFFLWKLKFS